MHHSESKLSWNQIAEQYQQVFMDLDIYNKSYQLFCEAISNSQPHILDIACGPGNITKYLLNQLPAAKILGIDNASQMIALAEKNNPAADFLLLDFTQIRQLKDKFDGVICGFALPYLSPEEISNFLAAIEKLLLQNGVLYLSFVEGESSNSGYKTGSTGHRIYFNYHNINKIEKHLVENGFGILEQLKIKYVSSTGEAQIHSVIIAKKSAL